MSWAQNCFIEQNFYKTVICQTYSNAFSQDIDLYITVYNIVSVFQQFKNKPSQRTNFVKMRKCDSVSIPTKKV